MVGGRANLLSNTPFPSFFPQSVSPPPLPRFEMYEESQVSRSSFSFLPLRFRARSRRPGCSSSSLYTSMFNRTGGESRSREGGREE